MQQKWQMIYPPAYLQAFWCLPGSDIPLKNRVVLGEIKANSWNQLQLVYVNKGDRSEQKQEAHLVNNCKRNSRLFMAMACFVCVLWTLGLTAGSCLVSGWHITVENRAASLFLYNELWQVSIWTPPPSPAKTQKRRMEWERGRAPLSVFIHELAISNSCFAQEFPRGCTTPLG